MQHLCCIHLHKAQYNASATFMLMIAAGSSTCIGLQPSSNMYIQREHKVCKCSSCKVYKCIYSNKFIYLFLNDTSVLCNEVYIFRPSYASTGVTYSQAPRCRKYPGELGNREQTTLQGQKKPLLLRQYIFMRFSIYSTRDKRLFSQVTQL